MIASVAFRNFKALRSTRLPLRPFNLLIGPNGSGKSSLIEAMMKLRGLAKLGPSAGVELARRDDTPLIEFQFNPPFAGVGVRLGCVEDFYCDRLELDPPGAAAWPALRAELDAIRSYVLDHVALAQPAQRGDHGPLVSNGANLAAVLHRLHRTAPDADAELRTEVFRAVPEFRSLELQESPEGRLTFGLVLAEDGLVPADGLSQGILYLLALLVIAYDPDAPRLVCIEEIDRGLHPRMLREVRDALYRLSYPVSQGLARRPVQVIATTHSPYLLDLFRDHPEEVVISQKSGRAARFERLSDRPDLPELLREGSLGEMWFSGILGGNPDER